MTDTKLQNEEFKKEVAEGKHPDWRIGANGELEFIGEMPTAWDDEDRMLANADFLSPNPFEDEKK